MISIIWMILLFIGIITYLLTGRSFELNYDLVLSITNSLDLLKNILPGILLWTGLMNIAEKSGLLNKLSILLNPLLKKLFPSIPKDAKALSYISSNIVANILGLGSVATPFGLKAMKELNTLNLNKKEASYAMQTFLVINTAGVTLIPSMVITLRISHLSTNPFIILIPSIIVTTLSCLFGIIINYFWRR